MENTLAGFMAQNAEKISAVKVAISSRFKDQEGNPIKWELIPITSEQDEELRKQCTRQVQMTGKPGVMIPRLDAERYMGLMMAECTAYPDLNDAQLQDSYRVRGADALLKTMLLPGEYANMSKKVQEINGFNLTMDERVEEAKN